MKRLVLACAVALVLMGNGNPACPRDGSWSSWTGKSEIAQSPPYQMLYQYQCSQWMHKFWSVDAPGTVR